MNTINLKFFMECTASLTLLCSFALCGCGGAENDLSALECFAGSCSGDDDKDHNSHSGNNQNFNENNSNNGENADYKGCDEHGFLEDFICDASTVGKTLFEENYNVILACEDTGSDGITWEVHPELSNCSDYKANNGGSSPKGSSNPLCGNLWCGPDHDKTVNTGFDDGTNTSGIWKTFDDQGEGGSSLISLNEDNEQCSGLCGEVLIGNSLVSNPYAGLYFNLVNASGSGANISSWQGLCITYQSFDKRPKIELVHQRGDEVASFVVYLDTDKYSANISWNDFLQEKKGTQVSLGRDAFLSQVASIKIYWQDAAAEPAQFVISTIGTYGSCP